MMLKAFNKFPVTKGIEILKAKGITPDCVNMFNRPFGSERRTGSGFSHSSKDNSSKNRKAFEDLKSQINSNQSQENLRKYALGNSFEGIKHKLYENFKFKKNRPEQTVGKEETGHSGIKAPYEALKTETEHHETHETETSYDKEYSKFEDVSIKEQDKVVEEKYRFSIKESWKGTYSAPPFVGTITRFISESWEQTFPTNDFQKKVEQIRKKAQMEKQKMEEMSAEELEKSQINIPEWKRTALVLRQEQEDKSLKRKIVGTLKSKVNETRMAQTIYQSEHYKEFQDVRKEMSQFKEDLKDHLTHSQNPIVNLSVTAYSKVTSESNTARAIQEMRKHIPGFSVYELEKDATGVFGQIYNAFLGSDIEFIEKTCSESALVFFRTLLKKRETDNVCPKYTCLWDIENADIIGGKVSAELNNRPCFTFTIRVQEIRCNVCKIKNKVVDGAEDRVEMNRYNFTLTVHENPDLETAGHWWQLVEILPVEAVQMLA